MAANYLCRLAVESRSSVEVARFHPRSPTERAPILPTLFMPGFPKSATSWLYECLLHAFSPTAVGCGRSASGWGADKCVGRRFAVTALESDARGRFGEKSANPWGSRLAVYPWWAKRRRRRR